MLPCLEDENIMGYRLDMLKMQRNKMVDLVLMAHKDQKYGDKDYSYHLNMVSKKVIELFGESIGEEEKLLLEMGALGQDLIEDTFVESSHLESLMIKRVVIEAIELVTKKEGLSYNDYLRQIAHHPIDLAFKVKVADTYCNLTESVKCGDIKRVKKYSSQLEKLYKLKGE